MKAGKVERERKERKGEMKEGIYIKKKIRMRERIAVLDKRERQVKAAGR